jgi:hypothetical protein
VKRRVRALAKRRKALEDLFPDPWGAASELKWVFGEGRRRKTSSRMPSARAVLEMVDSVGTVRSDFSSASARQPH